MLLAGLGIDFGGLGMEPLGYPATIAPWVIYAWLGLGLIVLGYFLVTDRSRIAQTRLLFTASTSEPETAGPERRHAGSYQSGTAWAGRPTCSRCARLCTMTRWMPRLTARYSTTVAVPRPLSP